MSKYKLSHTFSFVVPLSWRGVPFAEGATALSFLAADGSEASAEADAAKFCFRLFPTGRDDIAIQSRLDELNGGIAQTVDLDRGILNLSRSLRENYEQMLWPEGRPKAETPEEAAEQEQQFSAAWNANALDDEQDRAVLGRMQHLEERQRHIAEWPLLGQGLPPAFADLADAPLPSRIREAILTCYRRAKLEAETAAGK
jgi:hypothetical protein